ncbi:MAG: hypothetical protein WC359_15100 [Dehalococcoidia bacterium]|jgi:hypothetical protein
MPKKKSAKKMLTVWLSQSELDNYHRAAESDRRNLSSWVRARLDEAASKIGP